MKNLLKFTRTIILCCLCVHFFTSCKYVERKLDKRTLAKIEKCLVENKFSEARELAGGMYRSKKYEAENKISRAEITYYVRQNEFSRAKAVALEDNRLEMYNEISREWLGHLIENRQYDEALGFLSNNWTFEYAPKFEATRISKIDEVNEKCNAERNSYNDFVTKIISTAMYDDNINIITKGLSLYRNVMIVATKKKNPDGTYDVTFKKDNTALREMKKKLAQQNIKVD